MTGAAQQDQPSDGVTNGTAYGVGEGRLYVSVTEEHAGGRLVSELEITTCPGCAALVPADDVDRHVRWHRQG